MMVFLYCPLKFVQRKLHGVARGCPGWGVGGGGGGVPEPYVDILMVISTAETNIVL